MVSRLRRHLETTRRLDQSGASLLELISVVALIGIVSAVATGGWRATGERFALRQAAETVRLALERARQNAISQGSRTHAAFAEGASTFALAEGVDAAGEAIWRIEHLRDGVRVRSCSARDDTFTFEPRGHASSFGTLHLENHHGDSLRIIANLNGRVRISP